MKADIFKASLLAILAASLLGTTTYFASQQLIKEEHKPTLTLDAFTPKGGQGTTIVSSPYFSNENVSIYASVKDESNDPVANTSVVFQIYGPPNSNVTLKKTAITNSSGVAAINMTVPSAKDHPENVIGIWSVVATTQIVSGEQTVDNLIFEVEQPPSPHVDVYTNRGGQGSNTPASQPYKPNDTVTLYALVSDGINPAEGYLVAFTAFNTNQTEAPLLVRTNPSNASGIASIFFRLAPDPAVSAGTWQVLTKVMIKGQECVDTLTLQCKT